MKKRNTDRLLFFCFYYAPFTFHLSPFTFFEVTMFYWLYSSLYTAALAFLLPIEYLKRSAEFRKRWLRERFGIYPSQPPLAKGETKGGGTIGPSGSTQFQSVRSLHQSRLLKRLKKGIHHWKLLSQRLPTPGRRLHWSGLGLMPALFMCLLTCLLLLRMPCIISGRLRLS